MLPQFGFLNRGSLGQLNKNITQMSKRLAKIASARKLNSAADGAAEFAISEKMREQIRSLGQDMRNVQNGSSMIKTAAGGVENIVDMLREIKKKAIDAANDSNTDEDRATIQKEINQIRSAINDVAVDTQFNGKRLLNGLYGLQTTYTKERDGWIEPPKEYTLYAGETYTKTVEADGSRKVVGKIIGVNNKVKSLMGGFKAIDTTVRPASSLRSPANGGITADFGYDGTDSYWNWARAYEKSFFYKGTRKNHGLF